MKPDTLSAARQRTWRCGIALLLIVAGSPTTAKAQCDAAGGTATASTAGATAFPGGGGTGLTAVNLNSFRPVTGQSLDFALQTPGIQVFQQQAMFQQRAAANQRALAQKLAVMRQQAVAKKLAREASGETNRPVRKPTLELTASQREASQRYWATLASLQPGPTVH